MPATLFLRRLLRCPHQQAKRQHRLLAVLVGVSTFSTTAVRAQDVYFSQPYATRLHLNPAFTGLLDDASITLGYRTQHPTLIGTLQSSQLAADLRLRDQRSAIGLLVNADRGGSLNLTRLEAGFTYAYHARISHDLYVSGGAHAAYGSQRISYGNLLFGDQIDDDGQITGGTSAEPLVYDPVRYFTLGVGGLFYTPNTWGGLSLSHVNQPKVGVTDDSQLPFRLAVHGGYKHYFLKTTVKREYHEISLAPAATYTYQGGSQRLEVGAYGTATPIVVGAFWRGAIPGPNQAQQSLVALVGLAWNGFRLGYSYDVGISRFGRETGGAHEITLSLSKFDLIEAAKRRLRRKNYDSPPCPAF
jgi:type IX secretion system PorP/SprF family membrane protein